MTSFALVPAAGHSTRMGQPKLLMPVVGRPLIMHVLAAWRASRVDHVVAVVRPDDEPLAKLLRTADVELVIPPVAPPDMRASLQCGLNYIAARYRPASGDVWLVAPADMPGLSPGVIDRLLAEAAKSPGRVHVPTLAGRRGHPVLLPWPLATEVPRLAASEGLNVLIERNDPHLVACDAAEPHAARAFADVDTPGDVDRFNRLPTIEQ